MLKLDTALSSHSMHALCTVWFRKKMKSSKISEIDVFTFIFRIRNISFKKQKEKRKKECRLRKLTQYLGKGRTNCNRIFFHHNAFLQGPYNDILKVRKNPSSGNMPNLHKHKMAANCRIFALVLSYFILYIAFVIF